MDQYDPVAGEQAARAAIDQVSANADEDWKEAAIEAAERVARRQQFFTTDDVWSELAGGYSTHEPRAMGAVMRIASTGGACRPTERTKKSSRVCCHRRPLMVWESLWWTKVGEC